MKNSHVSWHQTKKILKFFEYKICCTFSYTKICKDFNKYPFECTLILLFCKDWKEFGQKVKLHNDGSLWFLFIPIFIRLTWSFIRIFHVSWHQTTKFLKFLENLLHLYAGDVIQSFIRIPINIKKNILLSQQVGLIFCKDLM